MVTPPLTLVSTEPWTEDKEILALPAARLPLTVALDPSAERFVEYASSPGAEEFGEVVRDAVGSVRRVHKPTMHPFTLLSPPRGVLA